MTAGDLQRQAFEKKEPMIEDTREIRYGTV